MVRTQPRKRSDFEPLTAAERQVLDELDTGMNIVLGDGRVPEPTAGPERRVRARFVRWLALCDDGVDHRLHEKGLRIRGALIASDGPPGAPTPGLDLEGCRLKRDLALIFCRFEDAPLLQFTQVTNLFLFESVLPGLVANGLVSDAVVSLNGVVSEGAISLKGARIGDILDCDGLRIDQPGSTALDADHVDVRGSFYLCDARIAGIVGLPGARIGSNLECERGAFENPGGWALQTDRAAIGGYVLLRGASFAGTVRLLGASIGANLECDGIRIESPFDWALKVEGVRVAGSLILRPQEGRPVAIEGAIDLTGAELGAIVDDLASWPLRKGSLLLDGCRYRSFTKHGVGVGDRLGWLAIQDATRYGQVFWTQPYEQCAKVLREMGHTEDAKDVLIEKERLLRRAERARINNWPGRAAHWVWTRVLEMVRYGYRPQLALLNAAGFVVLGWVVLAAWGGVMVPAKPPAPLSAGGAATAAPTVPFLPLVYSLETFVPVVSMGQVEAWRPDMNTRTGFWVQVYLWAHGVLGWLIGGVAVAGILGLFQRK